MQAGELLEFVARRPFVPFRITLTDGRTYEIRHPELAMVGRRSMIVGLRERGHPELMYDRTVTIDLLHVMQAELLERTPAEENGTG